ncbi:endonuclease-reverse transcriptase [Elysia marginata]|uniref:Endonuclease-reverse transcriptase n=1 Tax=Elysia marginata TaxID=1093978 RepID=A0AAV4IEB5_9GAST|nr:endonuclease-reverse transcriptase [Elysia marginata]
MSAGKLENITDECNRNNIDILGIVEHRWSKQGHFSPTNGGTFIYSGRVKPGQSGVAIYLNELARKYLLGYNPVDDRILYVQLKGTSHNISLIQVYAPTSASTEEELEGFYQKLQNVIDKCPSSDVKLIMGDFNAKVGQMADNCERGNIGKFGLGEQNDRGQQLVDFCIENEFAICNTIFENHPRRLFTWTSPDGNTKNQINYILVDKRWKTSVRTAKTLPSADCGSDHELLMSEIKLRLKMKKKVNRPVRYDLSWIQLNIPYRIEVKDHFSVLNETADEMTPDELAQEISNIFSECAQKHLPRKRNHNKPWVTTETLGAIATRKILKQVHGITSSDYKEANSTVKSLIKRDKRLHQEQKLNQIETLMFSNKHKEMYSQINALTREFRPRLNVIKDKNGNALTDQEEIVVRWAEYCREMYDKLRNNTTSDATQ